MIVPEALEPSAMSGTRLLGRIVNGGIELDPGRLDRLIGDGVDRDLRAFEGSMSPCCVTVSAAFFVYGGYSYSQPIDDDRRR